MITFTRFEVNCLYFSMVTHSLVHTIAAIVSDDDIFQQFTNEVSCKQYQRIWSHFVDFCGDFDLEAGQPEEELSPT
jgi:hypothetical protein